MNKRALSAQKSTRVTVEVLQAGPNPAVQVSLDGAAPETAEVQWAPGTVFRQAPAGRAANIYRDPRTFALSAARRQALDHWTIVARIEVDGEYLQSDPIEVEISEVQ